MIVEELKYDYLKESELEEVIKLYDAERPICTNIKKSKEILKEVINNSNHLMITVKLKKEILGFAKLEIHKDIFENCNPYMTVWSVRIKKEYRRNKIGTNLFRYIEKIAKEHNCEFVCLFAEKENKIANEFYQKLNYESINGYWKILK